MSSSNQISDPQETTSTDAPAITVGIMLREARDRAGFTRDELARRLCMTPDKLEALEQDAFERFAGTTYVRGYIRNLCKELGLDATVVMEAFVRQMPVEVAAEPARAPVGAVLSSRRERRRGSLSAPLILVLALAAGGGFWWFDQQAGDGSQLVRVDGAQDRDDSELLATASSYSAEADISEEAAEGEFPTVQSVETPEALADINEERAAVPEVDDGAPETDAELADVVPPDVETPSAEALHPVAERSAEMPSGLAPVAAAETVEAPSEAGTAPRLVISFQGESWLEVTDATGYKMIAKLQPAGSTVELNGRAPFSVMLGNAAAATITFDGQVVDSAPIGNRRTRKLSVGG